MKGGDKIKDINELFGVEQNSLDQADEHTDEESKYYEIAVEDSLVILEGNECHICICGIDFYYKEGIWCEKNDEDNFEPDWDLTWFYLVSGDPESFVYFEQDPPETAIYNLSRMLNDDSKALEELKKRVSDLHNRKNPEN